MTDGYQVYHALEKELKALKIAGCWAHCRRKFADVVKVLGKEKDKNTSKQNSKKCHLDNGWHF